LRKSAEKNARFKALIKAVVKATLRTEKGLRALVCLELG
jgi:hypothetical protein